MWLGKRTTCPLDCALPQFHVATLNLWGEGGLSVMDFPYAKKREARSLSILSIVVIHPTVTLRCAKNDFSLDVAHSSTSTLGALDTHSSLLQGLQTTSGPSKNFGPTLNSPPNHQLPSDSLSIRRGDTKPSLPPISHPLPFSRAATTRVRPPPAGLGGVMQYCASHPLVHSHIT